MNNKQISKSVLLLILLLGFAFPKAIYAQKKNKLERFIDYYYSIVEGDSSEPRSHYYFALPIWAISPETGIKVGVSLGYMFRAGKDSTTRPSLIRLNSSYTQLKQFNIRPSADIFFNKNEYNLKAQYVFNDFNEFYWGIGNQVTNSTKELYGFKQHKVNIRFTKQIITNLYLGPQVLYEHMDNIQFKEGSNSPTSNVSGINGYEIFGAGLALAFDNRSHIYYPLNGAYLEISNYYYFKSAINSHVFHGFTIDMRKYFQLWKENVLAIQGYGSLNFQDVPYRQMGTMGGEMFMRGYYNGRYRDKHLLTVQAEFRKTIWGPFGMVVFGGLGNVGRNETELMQHIKPNYGFGIRGMSIRREHINARLDFGFGEKGINGFYFTLSEAF